MKCTRPEMFSTQNFMMVIFSERNGNEWKVRDEGMHDAYG